jgi:hypothetical protein
MLENTTRISSFLSKAVANDFSEIEGMSTPEAGKDIGSKLNDENKYQITEIVRNYCPRVTSETSKFWGMFATPEAKDEVADFYDPIPFIKMIIEIIKLSKKDHGFSHKEGQKYARR